MSRPISNFERKRRRGLKKAAQRGSLGSARNYSISPVLLTPLAREHNGAFTTMLRATQRKDGEPKITWLEDEIAPQLNAAA